METAVEKAIMNQFVQLPLPSSWMLFPRRLDVITGDMVRWCLRRRSRPYIDPATLVMLHCQSGRWSEDTRSHGLIQLMMVLVAALVVLRIRVLPVYVKLSVLVFCWRGAETVTVMVVAVDKRAGVTVVRMRNRGSPGHG